jgi:hypothetical protein
MVTLTALEIVRAGQSLWNTIRRDGSIDWWIASPTLDPFNWP